MYIASCKWKLFDVMYSKGMLRDGNAINETWSGEIIDFYHVFGFTFALPKQYWVRVTARTIKKVSDDWLDPKVAKLPQLQGCHNWKPPYEDMQKRLNQNGRKLNLIVKASEGKLCRKKF